MISDSTLSRGREPASYRGVASLRPLLSLHIFPWVLERASFLSNYPIAFLAFSRPVLVPSPIQCLSWVFQRLVPFSNLTLFPDFPGLLLSSPIYGPTAHASQLCFVLASTAAGTQRKDFPHVFSLTLLIWGPMLVTPVVTVIWENWTGTCGVPVGRMVPGFFVPWS